MARYDKGQITTTKNLGKREAPKTEETKDKDGTRSDSGSGKRK